MIGVASSDLGRRLSKRRRLLCVLAMSGAVLLLVRGQVTAPRAHVFNEAVRGDADALDLSIGAGAAIACLHSGIGLPPILVEPRLHDRARIRGGTICRGCTDITCLPSR